MWHVMFYNTVSQISWYGYTNHIAVNSFWQVYIIILNWIYLDNMLTTVIPEYKQAIPSVWATVMRVLIQSTFLAFISVSGELAVKRVNRARHCTKASLSSCEKWKIMIVLTINNSSSQRIRTCIIICYNYFYILNVRKSNLLLINIKLLV